MCSSSGCRDKDHAAGIIVCVNQCVLCLCSCMCAFAALHMYGYDR